MQITICGTPFQEPECQGCPYFNKCRGEYYVRRKQIKKKRNK